MKYDKIKYKYKYYSVVELSISFPQKSVSGTIRESKPAMTYADVSEDPRQWRRQKPSQLTPANELAAH